MDAPHVPYDDLLGFHKTVRGPGDVVVSLEVDARHHNPMGVLHGGILVGLMDSAMGNNMTTLLEPGQRTTNTELQVRFLAPVTAGRLVAEACILHRTPRAVLWEATVKHDEAIVARATSTFLIRSSTQREGFSRRREVWPVCKRPLWQRCCWS